MPFGDRTASVRLDADIAGYLAKLRAADKATRDFATSSLKHAKANREAYETAGASLLGVGTAAVLAGGMAVKSFADFDSAMSAVSAATGKSGESMDRLRDAALEAGERTKYSATEAAGGIESLAKAGVNTADIVGGGLSGALNLAAAGEIEVGDAAEVAATAMTQFGLSGKQVPHIADLIAAAAGKAQGDVSDLSYALRQSGLVAGQMGLSIEETTGALGAFASAGLLGSDAGTSLKTMLLRLANPSAEAAGLMDDLGIKAYDAQGNFVGMSELAGQLKSRLSGMTQSQRDATLATIFGSDAIRAANVLYSEGASGIDRWVSKVDDQGYAAEQASARMDNLKGDIEELGGAFETALIKSGSGANDVLRGSTQAVTKAVRAYSNLPDPVQQGTTALAGVVGAAGLAGGSLLILLPKIADTREAWKLLRAETALANVSLKNTGRAMGALGRAGGVLTVLWGLVEVGDALKAKFNPAPDVDKLTNSLINLAVEGKATGEAAETFGDDLAGFEEDARRLVDKGTLTAVADGVTKVLSAGFNEGGRGMAQAKENIAALDESLAQMVESGHGDLARQMFRELVTSADLTDEEIRELREHLPAFRDALSATAAEQKAGAAAARDQAAASKEASYGLADVGREASLAETDLKGLVEEMGEYITQALGMEEANDAFAQGLHDAREQIEAAKQSEDGWTGTLKGNSEAALANREIMRGFVNSSEQVIETMLNQGKTGKQVERRTKTMADAVIRLAEDMGISRKGAKRYADMIRDLGGASATTTRKQKQAEDRTREVGEELVAATGRALGLKGSLDDLGAASAGAGQKHKRAENRTRALGEELVNTTGRALGLKGGLDKIPKDNKVKVSAPGLRGVRGQMQGLDSDINALNSKNIAIGVLTKAGRANIGAGGPGTWGVGAGIAAPGNAAGGKITGPGGNRDDAILGIGADGAPTAAVSNGEWVTRASSAAYYGDAIMAAVNEARIPRELLAAFAGLANGGRAGGPSVTAGADVSGMAAMRAQVQESLQTLLRSMGYNVALQQGLEFAASHAGKPYGWGAAGPHSFDCSGFQSAVTRYILGQDPYARLGSTGTFPWQMFAPGPGAYAIGSVRGSPGHMSGTINGTNVESRGGDGVVVGPSARSAGDSMFSGVWHLKGYAGGGQVGGDAPYDLMHPNGRHTPDGRARGWFWTGEDGPELVHAGSDGASVLNPHDSAALSAAMGNPRLPGYADGTFDLSDMLSRYDAMLERRYASRSDVRSSRRDRNQDVRDRTKAVRELRKAERQLRRERRDGDGDRKALRQAERDVKKERRELDRATRQLRKSTSELHRTERSYRKGNQTPYQRMSRGLARGIRNQARFLRNLETLAARGHADIARELHDLGGPEAEKQAAALAKAKGGQLNKVSGQMARATRQAARLEQMPARLAVMDALQNMRRPGPVEIAQAYGVSVEDVVAASQGLGDLIRKPNGANLRAELDARRLTYDDGGWLMPGTQPHNGTGQPEAVLTHRQWADVHRLVEHATRASEPRRGARVPVGAVAPTAAATATPEQRGAPEQHFTIYEAQSKTSRQLAEEIWFQQKARG